MTSHSDLRHNNFDFLRIVAATLVLFSHQYALSGRPEPSILGMSFGTFGVLVFFSISGFLVSQSWRQDPHALRFLAKRFLRIWPGLAVVTLVAALLLGPLVSTLAPSAYFSHPGFSDFLRTLKVVTVRYELPGVFEENMYPKAVNGSLWTIPLEVRCYFALLVIAFVGLLKQPLLVLTATLTSAIYYFYFAHAENFQNYFGLFFFAGVCMDLYRAQWEPRPVYLLAGAVCLALVLYLLQWRGPALLTLIPAAVILCGTRSTPVLRRFGRYGDISYGIYIYAFVVQQTLFWMVGKDFPFIAGMLSSMFVTALCAFLSWHAVEKPALSLKRYLRSRPVSQQKSEQPA